MAVFCQLQLDRVPRINSKVSYRNVAAINLDALRKDLSNSILCENMESFDLNELVNCYNKTLNSILDQYAPLKTKTVTKRPIVPWFNDQVKAAKRQRRKAEKKRRRTNLNSDLADYKLQKNQTTFVMNCARKAFYTDFISQKVLIKGNCFKPLKFSLHKYLIFCLLNMGSLMCWLMILGIFLSRRFSASMLSLILLPLKQTTRLSQNLLS